MSKLLSKNVQIHFRMPFDWRTPFGYLVVVVFQSLLWFFACVNCSFILSFMIGVCLMLMLIVDDVVTDFSAQLGNRKGKLSDAIQFHSTVKQ